MYPISVSLFVHVSFILTVEAFTYQMVALNGLLVLIICLYKQTSGWFVVEDGLPRIFPAYKRTFTAKYVGMVGKFLV